MGTPEGASVGRLLKCTELHLPLAQTSPFAHSSSVRQVALLVNATQGHAVCTELLRVRQPYLRTIVCMSSVEHGVA